MQHNSWKKDRDLLSEAYTQINEALTWADDDAYGSNPTPGLDSGKTVGEEGESNILERLEEFMNSHPETVEGLRQIIIDFEDIIDDINSLEAPDQKIDAVDLGIHLARLAPDTTKGSAL